MSPALILRATCRTVLDRFAAGVPRTAAWMAWRAKMVFGVCFALCFDAELDLSYLSSQLLVQSFFAISPANPRWTCLAKSAGLRNVASSKSSSPNRSF